MKLLKFCLCFSLMLGLGCKKNEKISLAAKTTSEAIENNETLKIIPISHATFILESENQVIYIDPTGELDVFNNQKKPTLVLITDIHGDHLNLKTLEALGLKNTPIIAPKAVFDKIPSTVAGVTHVLNNGETITLNGINVEAIPMYNLREEALKFHTKGRGNGYVLTVKDERIYISGDTEDIREMRDLKNIDKAFVCMNLPYTMPVSSAASAVLDFKPKQVYPYHYRGTGGLSDIENFKTLVSEDPNIEVVFLDWYR